MRIEAERRFNERASVAAVEIHTPQTRPSTMTPPMATDPPPAGCSTEDLRLWMLQVVKAQATDANSLELRIASQMSEIHQTMEHLSGESQAVKKDIGVFAAIKHLVTDTQLETRTESINTDIKMLTAQTNGFAEHLNGYLVRTEAMEKNSQ